MLLGVGGGYVDTAGFLSLHGLFTTHVTGNFVTLGAALVNGSGGVVAKLLALPVFCVVVAVTRFLSVALPATRMPPLRIILTLQGLLLTAGAILAIRLGPFVDGDGWQALLTGMTLVAAMAIQNAVHRIHMSAAPPTTVMTGTTAQVMIDLADLLRRMPAETRAAIRLRLRRLSVMVAAFAVGCAAGALFFAKLAEWCFIIPPLLTAWAATLPDAATVQVR